MDFLTTEVRTPRLRPQIQVKKCHQTSPACSPPSDGRCVWNKLPQEIKDFIFELAYVSNSLVSPIHKSSWQPRICECDHSPRFSRECNIQSALHDDVLEAMWNPVVPMELLMVDHEWYCAAAKVFYSRTNFFLYHNQAYDDFRDHYQNQQMMEFIFDGSSARPYTRFITTLTVFLDDISVTTVALDIVKRCPSVQHLHLQVTLEYFQDFATDTVFADPYRTIWSADEFEQYDATLFQLRGIKNLTANAAVSPFEGHGGPTFEENVSLFGSLIIPLASRPRPTDWHLIHSITDDEDEDEDEAKPLAPVDHGKEIVHEEQPFICPWNKLPQELKEVILKMAYVPRKSVRPLPKAVWDDEEAQSRELHDKDYEARWFPAKLVERFLVSREWYETASTAYYKHSRFSFNDPEKFVAFASQNGKPHVYSRLIRRVKIYLEYETDSTLAEAIALCPSLKFLQLRLWSSFFDGTHEHVDPTVDFIDCATWSKADFETYWGTESLLQIRDVPNVEVILYDIECEWYREHPDEKRCTIQNIAALEKLVQSAAARPRVNAANIDGEVQEG